MTEAMLAEVVNYAEYLQQKENSKGGQIKMEKEKMIEFKELLEGTYGNLKEIIRFVEEDEEIRKIDSLHIFKEKGNEDIIHDLLADFTDAIDILNKEA